MQVSKSCVTASREAILEAENNELRKRIAYLERCLFCSEDGTYRALGLTVSEERVFAALMNCGFLSKDQLLTIAYADKPNDCSPDSKTIDVCVCRMRKKLKPLGIEIGTLWRRGYVIDAVNKQLVRELATRAGDSGVTGNGRSGSPA